MTNGQETKRRPLHEADGERVLSLEEEKQHPPKIAMVELKNSESVGALRARRKNSTTTTTVKTAT
jgi:hypothetical protein